MKKYLVIEEYCNFVLECVEYRCHYEGTDPKAAVAAAHKACANKSTYSDVYVEVRTTREKR